MTDFIADLERELVAAARRRATGRRRVVLLPRLRLATVVAVVALAALLFAALAVVRGLDDGPRPGDERPSVPPRPSVALALPAAEEARPCPGVSQRETAGEAPEGVDLGIFTRPMAAQDALPSLTGADSYSWIRMGTIHPDSARRPAPGQFDAELHIVAGAEPREGGGCEGHLQADLAVCLVVGAGEPVVKCFPNADVEAGRAFAVTGRGVVHGILPDGIASATLRWNAGTHTVAVRDNVVEAHLPLEAGDTVRVELEPSDACRPNPDLLDAVPALRDAEWDTLPTVDGGKWQWGRRVGGDELDVLVVAPCEEGERACVVAVYDERGFSEQCGTAAQIRQEGMWAPLPVAGRLGVVGVAPHGASRAQVILDGRDYREVPTSGGVFATILPLAYELPPVEPGDPGVIGEASMFERLEMRFPSG
jgi:hypothetical protein